MQQGSVYLGGLPLLLLADGLVAVRESSPASRALFARALNACYTKQGLELTRVTVINSELKVVYDTFVKPDRKVVDYNTRFSGVTEADLEDVTITLRDVQAVLLNMFSADTILIGHSLESDLFALQLLHDTVVDTSVVFPHRLGLPYKRALRTLMADYLKRIIQDSVEGHDSSEDARACMELMIWKIKEDAKVKR
ncbi:PREDICTED: RNA exonuclease 1 homolog [Gekko japonicus]|uniref:RNA exonuclease 1 homolog n=1 Tax=Gekko japonicus TaxID=146911 RepID=A0ABM1LFR6_GEKJA|nr:PREDICTED: RNA exonuclease 1 homolog [Gekko japonicus]